MQIQHYTKAATLPLILESGKIRFTRADNLDDMQELPFEAFHASSKNYYINSWVKSDSEKSGQWYRYGDQHKGICVIFEESPFPEEIINLNISRQKIEGINNKVNLGLTIRNVQTAFTKETMLGKGFILIPWAEMSSFANDVIYTENPKEYVTQFIKTNTNQTEITHGSTICRVKSIDWQDQSEYRFVLMAAKGPDLFYTNNCGEYENEFINMMEENSKTLGKTITHPDVNYIDLPIDKKKLDKMKIILGSKISDEDREKVIEAIKNHAPNAIVLDSEIKIR